MVWKNSMAFALNISILLSACVDGVELPSVPRTGDMAPEIQAEMLETGEPVLLSDYQGETVLVNIWATWCIPCRVETPFLQETYERFQDQGLKILGISVDSPFSNAAFAEANGITFPLLSDVHREAVEAYGVALGEFVIPGYTVAQRSVFVVETDGSIGYAWVADNPGLEPDYDAVMPHCESP